MYQGSILLCQTDFYLDIGGNLHHHHQESDLTEDWGFLYDWSNPINELESRQYGRDPGETGPAQPSIILVYNRSELLYWLEWL